MQINKVVKSVAVFLIFSLNVANLNATAYISEEFNYPDKLTYEYLYEEKFLLEEENYIYEEELLLGEEYILYEEELFLEKEYSLKKEALLEKEYLSEKEYLIKTIKADFSYIYILGNLGVSYELPDGSLGFRHLTSDKHTNIEVLFYFDGELFNALFLTTLEEIGLIRYEITMIFHDEHSLAIFSFSESLGFEGVGPGISGIFLDYLDRLW